MPVVTVGDKALLFIHVPKTAGMSVARFLETNGEVTGDDRLSAYGARVRLRHLHEEPLKELYSKACFDWSFMVVRHPVKRMISEYRYQTRKYGLHLQNFMPFSPWLRYCLARSALNPSFRENHFRPQAEFRAFDAEIFRLEDGLERLVSRFKDVTGKEDMAPMPHENASPKTRQVAPSERDIELIRQRFARDFEEFGYE